jgi:hypothetical protein
MIAQISLQQHSQRRCLATALLQCHFIEVSCKKNIEVQSL